MIATKQIGKNKKQKKLDSEHNIENTVTYCILFSPLFSLIATIF